MSIVHQLSFEDFFLPFDGKLSGDTRSVKLAKHIQWDVLEYDYAAQLFKDIEGPTKPFRMALGTAIINACLELTDEELVKRIKVNPYLQLFIGLGAFQASAPFDSSMMVDFRKRLPEAVVNDYNERIVRHGLKVMRSSDSQDPSDDGGSGDGSVSLADHPRPSTQKQPNQGSRLIDATCAPVDICHPEEVVACCGHEEEAPDQQDPQGHQARARPPEAEPGEH